ncbi:hypothetical protein F5B20DRAFT_547012 [Whalleya microplaca]|nr:hypothetical protein F5B20DRAFT_547012 [Whalleya microplaca]
MTKDHFDPVVVGIVRRYSDEIAGAIPENVLERSVAAYEAALQVDENKPTVWRHWLRFDTPEPDPVVASLQVEAKEAADLWRRLKLDIGDLGPSGDQVPTVETLWAAVHQARVQWDEKSEKGFGRAKTHFFSFLETMEAHKYLFSIIPNGDKYTSLVTGVITSIVKASVNHEAIAEGFSRALQGISRDLNFVRRGTRMCNTSEMKGHVVLLYREVFTFLSYTMKWYSSSWNRFKKAFDNRFYDKHVEGRVKSIQGLVQRVRDEMKLASDGLVQNIHSEQRAGFIETRSRIEELDDKLDRFVRMIGQQMSKTMMANAQHELSDSAQKHISMENIDGTVRIMGTDSDRNEITAMRRRQDIEQLKTLLAPFSQNGVEEMFQDSVSSRMPLIPNEVSVDIQQWAKSRDSSLLWVEGPAHGSFEDAISSIGARIWAISEEAGIACIGFFAKPKYAFESQGGSIKDASIVSMLYSLIMQLINIAQNAFEPFDSLTGDKLQRLDGTMQSIPTALEILKACLSSIEPGLICILCGFELVDCRENLTTLIEVIELLRDQSAERRVKVLVLSCGNCEPWLPQQTQDSVQMLQGWCWAEGVLH